jgi:hypothetical protein
MTKTEPIQRGQTHPLFRGGIYVRLITARVQLQRKISDRDPQGAKKK